MRLHPFIRTVLWLGAVLPIAAASACAGKPNAAKGHTLSVSGTVTYRPRIALPPDAVVRVRLEHATSPDAASAPLAEQLIPTDGRQVPIAFDLQLPDSLLMPTEPYLLRAEIRGDGGVLMWTNSAAYRLPQPASSQQNVELVVTQATPSDRTPLPDSTAVNSAADSATAAAFTNVDWHLVRMQPVGASNVNLAHDEGYTIRFDAKGRYNGQAHCNRYGGDYQLKTPGALTLLQGISTLAACAPPSSSNVFMRLLHAATSVTHASDTLRLTSPAQGSLVFTRQSAR